MAWTALKEAEAQKQAQEQHGVLTFKQLKAIGCSRRTIERRVRAKHWDRLYAGVFRLCHSRISSWHQMLMATILSAGEGAFASHGAAIRLHELDGMDDERPVEISVNGGTRGGSSALPIHRVDVKRAGNITEVDGIPCSTVERSLMEVAHQWPEEEANLALDSALRKKKATLKGIRFYLSSMRKRGRHGVRKLERLMDAHSGVHKDSGQEVLLLTRVIRPRKLPEPVHNFKLRKEDGTYRKIDYVWPALAMAVELHSKKAHTSAEQRKNDTEKANLCAAAGLTLYTYWYEDLQEAPDTVGDQLETALRRAAENAA